MADDGASANERVIYACRDGHEDLFHELLSELKTEEGVADLLNLPTDGLGQHCLHLAAANGHATIVDDILYQAGVEVDPIDPLEKETPLHKAVRYINNCPKEEWADKTKIVEYLLDAGADPKIRNKAKLKPSELVDPRNKELRAQIQKAEFTQMVGSDVVDTQAEAEEAATGSASE